MRSGFSPNRRKGWHQRLPCREQLFKALVEFGATRVAFGECFGFVREADVFAQSLAAFFEKRRRGGTRQAGIARAARAVSRKRSTSSPDRFGPPVPNKFAREVEHVD